MNRGRYQFLFFGCSVCMAKFWQILWGTNGESGLPAALFFQNCLTWYPFICSYCKDYISEKAIRPLNYGTVPIVYGAGNYTAILPPRSFINTADFQSAKELALYLWSLVLDFRAYEKYYDWRYHRSSTALQAFTDASQISTCKLCGILWSGARRRSSVNIHNWWVTDANCRSPYQSDKKITNDHEPKLRHL